MKLIVGIIISILLLSSLISLSSCKSKVENQENTTKINVQVTPVVEKTLAVPIKSSGKLYHSKESKLSFKIPGIVAHIYVREGQSLKKGTLLAALDMIEIRAKANQAQTAYQKAQRDLGRVKRLYADSVVTLEQLQNTTSALDIATSVVKIADFNLHHSEIYAPEDGTVLKQFAEEGELTGSGNPVFLYGASEDGWVLRCGVTEQQIIQLRTGDQGTITFDAYPDRKFSANIKEFEAVANPYTGTYEVELKLDHSNIRFYSGFIGQVIIIPGIGQKYSIVPVESLVEGNEKEGYVYAYNRATNSAIKHKVWISHIVKSNILIESGLENVNEVVTFGAPYLTDRTEVNIAEGTY
jgi:multidrug efflux system membrane fusion protein